MGSKKYLSIPIVFVASWLPAFLLNFIVQLNPSLGRALPTALFEGVRWIFAAVFLIGWALMICLLADPFPSYTAGGISIYFGLNIMIISAVYSGKLSALPHFITLLAGAVSYTPLRCVSDFFSLRGYPGEAISLVILSLTFLVAWLLGWLRGRRKRLYFS